MTGARRVGLGTLALAVALALVVSVRVLRRTEWAPRGAPQGEGAASEPRPASVVAGETHTEPMLPPAEGAESYDEAAFMERLRSVEDSDPGLALDLAREGNLRYPTSAAAAERAKIVVKSLARLGKASEARGEAEEMVNRYAGTRWALEVEMHTGAHPHSDRVRP
jgi:hypothetical protein